MFENGCYLRRQKRFKCEFNSKRFSFHIYNGILNIFLIDRSGNKRDGMLRGNLECDSNNNRSHGTNINSSKGNLSISNGQQSPSSLSSDKSCDDTLILIQQQQQQQQNPPQHRSMYVAHPQQQSSDSSEPHHFLSNSTNANGKPLKQEQCELSQIPLDSHSFANYPTFTLNPLMLHQGFADNAAALNAYYVPQLPQTTMVTSSSTDYYHLHHPSMYASS